MEMAEREEIVDEINFESEEETNFNNLCRLCLSNQDIFSIFKNDKIYDNDENLCSIICQCVAVKISSNDGLSDFICQICYNKINSWHDFKTICSSTQVKLNDWLSKNSSPESAPAAQKILPISQPTIRVKQELLEDIPNEEEIHQEDDLNIIIQNPTSINESESSSSHHASATSEDTQEKESEHPQIESINDEPSQNFSDGDNSNSEPQSNQEVGEKGNEAEAYQKSTEVSGNVAEGESLQENGEKENEEELGDEDRDYEESAGNSETNNENESVPTSSKDYQPLLLAHQIKAEPRVVLEELADEMLQNHMEYEEDDEEYFENEQQQDQHDFLSCPVCFVDFETTEQVMQHLCNMGCKIKYTCSEPDCLKVLDTFDNYRAHYRIHYRPYTCMKCKTCLWSKERYLKHRNSPQSCVTYPNLNYDTLSCNICAKTYATKEHLSKHVCGQKYFFCPKCKRQCTSVGRLTSHVFKCLTAQVMQDSTSPLERPTDIPQYPQHSQKEHFEQELEEDDVQNDMQQNRRSKRTLYTCECLKTFSNETQLQIHKVKDHPLNIITDSLPSSSLQATDEFSKQTFDYSSPRIRLEVPYRNRYDPSPYQISSYSGNLNCKICRRRFQSENKLRRHLQAHLSIKLYKCHICHKSLSCEDSLQKHFSLLHGTFFPKEFIIKNNKCQKNSQIYEHYLEVNNLLPNISDKSQNEERVPQELEEDLGLEEEDPLLTEEVDIKPNMKNKYFCQICQRSFFDQDLLNGHMKAMHSSMRSFKCSLCPKSFSGPKQLYQHNKIHRGKKLNTCQVCMNRFLTPVQLRRHKEEKHVMPEHFPCIRCNNETVFSNEQEWIEHQNIHPKTRHYSCPLCLKVFFNMDQLNQHRRSHLLLKLYNCSACGNSYNTLNALAKHKRVCGLTKNPLQQVPKIENFNEKNQMDEGEEESYECNVCFRVFKHAQHLNEHMTIQHMNPPPEIEPLQQKHTQSQQQPQQQQQQPPILDREPSLENNNFQCPVCYRVFNRRHNYLEHMRSHQRKLGFITKNPQQIATKKKKLKCHICFKHFNRSQNLHSHLRAHQRHLLREQQMKYNEDPSLGNEPQTEQSEQHTQLQQKEKSLTPTPISQTPPPSQQQQPQSQQQEPLIPLDKIKSEYKCPICAKTFDQAVKMKLHKNYHFKSSAAKKPTGQLYSCQLCGQNFTSKVNLYTHRNFCQQVFKTKTMPSRAAKTGKRSVSPLTNQQPSSTTPSTSTATSTIQQNQINNIDSSTIDPLPSKNEISTSSLYQDEVYTCNQCPREFLNKKALATHRTKAHPPVPVPQMPPVTTYVCHICSKQFSNRANLKRHIHSHSMMNRTQPAWANTPPSTSTSRRHTMPSQSASNYGIMNQLNPMGEIEDDFDDDIDLLDDDDDIMDHPPKLQPQMPPQPSLSQQQQQRGVSGGKNEEFPFQCMICNRGFKLKQYLVAHFRQHTGERPYKCRFCPNTYARSAMVYKHCLKNHAQEYSLFRRQKMMDF